MNAGTAVGTRREALERARRHSPFLREALESQRDIGAIFDSSGAEAAVAKALAARSDSLDSELRRQRLGLALAVALGDLAGELSLEEVTSQLSNFADGAIDRAVRAALGERVPDAEFAGFTVIAMGKLGSSELNYSSDVDLMLLFDPETLPKRHRDDSGEAAVRLGRRMIELLQKRTEDGYVARV